MRQDASYGFREKIVKSKRTQLQLIAIGLNGKIEYALEGSIFVGGTSVQWLKR